MQNDPRGTLHSHDGVTTHRHFAEGFTIGSQTIPDDDGSGEHSHGTMTLGRDPLDSSELTTSRCPGCGGPVQVWSDPSEGVTVNFACDDETCPSGKAPWDSPRPDVCRCFELGATGPGQVHTRCPVDHAPPSPRYRVTLTLESGTLIEFDVEESSTPFEALTQATQYVETYDLTGGEPVLGIMLQEILPCDAYGHSVDPAMPCAACQGTGWVVRASEAVAHNFDGSRYVLREGRVVR